MRIAPWFKIFSNIFSLLNAIPKAQSAIGRWQKLSTNHGTAREIYAAAEDFQ
jgi:hypothetical protein